MVQLAHLDRKVIELFGTMCVLTLPLGSISARNIQPGYLEQIAGEPLPTRYCERDFVVTAFCFIFVVPASVFVKFFCPVWFVTKGQMSTEC